MGRVLQYLFPYSHFKKNTKNWTYIHLGSNFYTRTITHWILKYPYLLPHF